MQKSSKKRAFTLTELLVVVVVIGVLSAVVLPKFNKVIETRRTTEAEELMGAIRTEQEKRCALDKNYLTQISDMSDIVKSDQTKNYKLTLASTGVQAERREKYNYTLSIPSYADGRICCSGADCDKLNKNYPKCEDFTPEASPEACVGEAEVTPDPEPGPSCDSSHQEGESYTQPCECGEAKGTWHCGSDTGYVWKRQTTTSCRYKPSDDKQACEDGNGTQTRSYVCENGQWTAQDWGECVLKKPCEPDTSTGCASGEKWADCSHFDENGGWCYRFTWDTETCTWVKQGAGGPPAFCTKAKTAMSPYYCECNDPEPEPVKWVWKQVWKQSLLVNNGEYTSSSGYLTDVNNVLLRCKGLNQTDLQGSLCGEGVRAGASCSQGDRCLKKLSSSQLFGQYCEFGLNPRVGDSVNVPCNEQASDSFLYKINKLCGGDWTSGTKWRESVNSFSSYRLQEVEGWACLREN